MRRRTGTKYRSRLSWFKDVHLILSLYCYSFRVLNGRPFAMNPISPSLQLSTSHHRPKSISLFGIHPHLCPSKVHGILLPSLISSLSVTVLVNVSGDLPAGHLKVLLHMYESHGDAVLFFILPSFCGPSMCL